MLEGFNFHKEYIVDETRNPIARKAAIKKAEVIALDPYAKMFSIGLEIRSAPLFCTPEVNMLGTEIGWFRALGLPVDVFTKGPDMLSYLMNEQACWSMVIIDCDSNGGMEYVLGQLEKGIRPDLKIPFVLVSRELETVSLWNAQSPKETEILDHTFSIDNMEETVFVVSHSQQSLVATS